MFSASARWLEAIAHRLFWISRYARAPDMLAQLQERDEWHQTMIYMEQHFTRVRRRSSSPHDGL